MEWKILKVVSQFLQHHDVGFIHRASFFVLVTAKMIIVKYNSKADEFYGFVNWS